MASKEKKLVEKLLEEHKTYEALCSFWYEQYPDVKIFTSEISRVMYGRTPPKVRKVLRKLYPESFPSEYRACLSLESKEQRDRCAALFAKLGRDKVMEILALYLE